MGNTVGALFNDPTYRSLHLAMNAAAQRHSAIATNIANVNTPGFKRIDLSTTFQAEMKQALQQLDQTGTTNSGTLPTPTLGVADDQELPRLDGNTVKMEKEIGALMENQSRFDFAAQMTARNIHMLRVAATGKTP